MFNSIDTSSGEINTVGCDTSFPKFIDYHNQLPYVSNSPHCNNVKTPFLRSRLPDYTRDHTVSFEKQGLNQLPAEVMERKTILISLNLSNNKFEYFPLEILQIKTLRTLRLDYNKIKSVPSDIFQLANLESLSLSYNALQFLPASISKLGRLKELNLEHNILDNLPQEIGEFQCLKILNILNNRLDNIPTSFGSLVSIQEFSIEWFRYTEPKLSVHQRGYCSEHNINKLRDKCNELQRNGVKTLFFEGFLELFSFSKRNFLATDDLGRTLLHFACLNQDISVIKYLISHTPEIIDIADKNNLTALCLSLLEDKQKSVHCLLKYGANVSQGGGSFGSPLHIATKRLNYNAVQKILQRGEDTNKTDIKGNTPLHYAVDLMTEKYDEARRIAQQLLDYKADPNIKNKENWTPLHCIAKKRDARALSWALSYNLEVEEIDGGEEIFKLDKSGGNFNWTAMHIAVYVGAFELVVKLGEADADMFKKSVNGYTPKAVSSKHGLALKFAEKYEQKWIKKHLLHKKASHSESLAYQNLLRFNNKKEISNASKNKFEGACLMIPYAPQESSFTLNNITKTRVRMLSPLLGTGLMTRRQEEESFDFTPESPTSISAEEEEVPSEDCDFIDFNSELNEGNNGEGNTYAKEVPMSHKKENNIKQPAAINSTNEASGSYFKKDQGKEKGSGFAQQAFEFDNDTYETRLKEMTNFDITFCKTELRFLKDHLMLTKLSFTEKMKIFISFKILHKVIVEYICTKFGDRISPGLLPYITLTNRQNASINSFYELVPQCLINCFMSLETQNYETAMNKLQLVKMLTEMKYYPAIDFFQNVVNNPLEAFWVKQEARNGYNSLTLSLGLDARKSRK